MPFLKLKVLCNAHKRLSLDLILRQMNLAHTHHFNITLTGAPVCPEVFFSWGVFLHTNDTIFTASCGHAWLMPTVSELLWSLSLFRWLSPAADVLWKCDWRFQWVSPFSWAMTCNDVARFWYRCASDRLSYNITQVYTNMHVRAHTHTHTHTHTLCEYGCLLLNVSVATILDSLIVNKQLKKFCNFRTRGRWGGTVTVVRRAHHWTLCRDI